MAEALSDTDLRALISGTPSDWNALWLEHGARLLKVVQGCLASDDANLRRIGLNALQEALFEEDEENVESPASLHELPFTTVVAPLAALLKRPDAAPEAVRGLWVCAREGADLRALDPAALGPFLDKERGKEKVRGTPLRTLAFLVVVHARAQRGQVQEALPLLKGNAAFKTALFGELTAHAAGSYDMKPVLALAIQESQAKGEGTVRTACEVLWALARHGVDIGEAIPHLLENQLRLGMFCSAPQVVATYFIRQGQLDRLHAWATDPDEKKRQWAWRGVNISGRQGVDLAGVRADARFRSLWPELMGPGEG